MSETIAAIATAQGRGGVAIIRISGDGALPIASAMFSAKEFIPNILKFGSIDCGDFMDSGMCVYFRAPHSFTGEDTVEFHCHGGNEIARGILKRAISLGARLAERGEFTMRAYLNGKLSLSAIEGMGDMIAAESAAQVRAAYLLYSEALTKEGIALQKIIKECLAAVDADFDYPEEDLTADVRNEILPRLKIAQERLGLLKNQYRSGKKIKSGVNVAICGRPNAGKSSLLNALLGYERAIVSSLPGTTRDIVEGTLELHGILFRLTDTAGLRESGDEIEREGIRRAENAIKGADVIIYLKEKGDNIEFPPEASVITVGAKCDLKKTEDCDLELSALTGEGIENLKELLYERGFGSEYDETFLMEERHYEAVNEALEALFQAQNELCSSAPIELCAESLKRAYAALGTISGETASENVIEEIFSKFCVGK